MTLSDRLAHAAAERARAEAEGTTVADLRRHPANGAFGLRPEATPAPVAAILISGTTTVTAVEPDPGADPKTVCPTCGRTGHLGLVDLPGRTSDYACDTCGSMWRITLPLDLT